MDGQGLPAAAERRAAKLRGIDGRRRGVRHDSHPLHAQAARLAGRGRRGDRRWRMSAWLMLLIPLLGAVAVMFAPPKQAKWIALLGTTVTFIVNVIAAVGFKHWTDGKFGLESSQELLPAFGVTLHVGADSVSMLLVLLTTLLMPLCVWGSFTAVTERVREYYGWMLVLTTAMVGVFVARDLIFFYVCFELTLVPM